MICIVNVFDVDFLFFEVVLVFYFNYVVIGGFDRKVIMGKDICVFMNLFFFEVVGIFLCVVIVVIGFDWKWKCMFVQINMVVSFKQFYEFRYDFDCLIMLVIILKFDMDVVFICVI